MYHIYGEDGLFNTKFISNEGERKYEGVYNKEGLLLAEENDPVNMGLTYFAQMNNRNIASKLLFLVIFHLLFYFVICILSFLIGIKIFYSAFTCSCDDSCYCTEGILARRGDRVKESMCVNTRYINVDMVGSFFTYSNRRIYCAAGCIYVCFLDMDCYLGMSDSDLNCRLNKVQALNQYGHQTCIPPLV